MCRAGSSGPACARARASRRPQTARQLTPDYRRAAIAGEQWMSRAGDSCVGDRRSSPEPGLLAPCTPRMHPLRAGGAHERRQTQGICPVHLEHLPLLAGRAMAHGASTDGPERLRASGDPVRTRPLCLPAPIRARHAAGWQGLSQCAGSGARRARLPLLAACRSSAGGGVHLLLGRGRPAAENAAADRERVCATGERQSQEDDPRHDALLDRCLARDAVVRSVPRVAFHTVAIYADGAVQT